MWLLWEAVPAEAGLLDWQQACPMPAQMRHRLHCLPSCLYLQLRAHGLLQNLWLCQCGCDPALAGHDDQSAPAAVCSCQFHQTSHPPAVHLLTLDVAAAAADVHAAAADAAVAAREMLQVVLAQMIREPSSCLAQQTGLPASD